MLAFIAEFWWLVLVGSIVRHVTDAVSIAFRRTRFE